VIGTTTLNGWGRSPDGSAQPLSGWRVQVNALIVPEGRSSKPDKIKVTSDVFATVGKVTKIVLCVDRYTYLYPSILCIQRVGYVYLRHMQRGS
jgi:hypothetical protein